MKLGGRFVLAFMALTVLCAQTPPVFRTGISLAHVDAEVVGQNGRVLTGLVQSDFRVFDEGQEQSLVAFAAEEQPLDLILLFDVSGSMRSSIRTIAAAAEQASRELRPGDFVSVMTFTTHTRIVSNFTDDREAVRGTLARLGHAHPWGGTCIQESVGQAAMHFLRYDHRKQYRRAILVVTDNIGRPAHSETEVIESLWEADSLLSGLIVHHGLLLNPSPSVLLIQALHLLPTTGGVTRIAEQTGGEVLPAEDLAHSFPEMIHRIRTRYSVYYRLPEDAPAKLRSVRVLLSEDAQQRFPGARVLARQAYRTLARDGNGFAVR